MMVKKRNLTDLSQDILLYTVLLQELKWTNISSNFDIGSPDELRIKIKSQITDFERLAREAKIDKEDIQQALFALVAFLDETIKNSSWKSREVWQANPLAAELFSSFIAGKEFFTRLDALRKNAKEKIEVIKVYLQCLQLGFRGEYANKDEKLRLLTDEIFKEIKNYQPDFIPKQLSLQWQLPTEITARSNIPPLWAIAACATGIAVIFYSIMQWILDSQIH